MKRKPKRRNMLNSPDEVQWRRVNAEPCEYAIQQGRFGDEFVKLLDGSCLRRPLVADDVRDWAFQDYQHQE
jgi:hypothetical protein